MIKVRVDDFPSAQPTEHYTPENLKLLQTLERLQIPYYLGVTPDLVSWYDLEYIGQQLKFAKIAMHGFNHGFDKWRPNSEFDNQSEDLMYLSMQRGLDILEYFKPIEVFVPPFNMFNQTLLNILKTFNFKYITGGPETLHQMDVKVLHFDNLKLLMSYGQHYTSNGHLKNILNLMPTVKENEIITLHLTGNYDLSGL